MTDYKHFGLMASNFKCFDDFQGFRAFYPVNLIIGRNNAGKSALLDLVQGFISKTDFGPEFYRKTKEPTIRTSLGLTEAMLRELHREGAFSNQALSHVTKVYANSRVETFRAPDKSQHHQILLDDKVMSSQEWTQFATVVRKKYYPHDLGNMCVRLRADRDIEPEPANSQKSQIQENGRQATALVEAFLNEGNRHDVVEQIIRSDLNTILGPDWRFDRIQCKRDSNKNNQWEIKLETNSGVLVPLSQSGSGIKTLLLVLINLHLVPKAKNLGLSSFIFCFEELENNLHPAVQRRLFKFVRDFAVKNRCILFLTTHSAAVIDMFNDDRDAQIVHVVNDRERAIVQQVSTYLHQTSVLDDLDVRASDLLQSNVVVWVEGPSDRLYFNRWIELLSDGSLQEHIHYQCIFYGGSNLASLSLEAELPDEVLVAGLKINRHAIILMDSDLTSASGVLKARVQRVYDEANRSDSFPWVTGGQEVENYIPWSILSNYTKTELKEPPGPFTDLFDLLKSSYANKKTEFARKVIPFLTKDLLVEILDLDQQMKHVCGLIRKWNGLSAEGPVIQ